MAGDPCVVHRGDTESTPHSRSYLHMCGLYIKSAVEAPCCAGSRGASFGTPRHYICVTLKFGNLRRRGVLLEQGLWCWWKFSFERKHTVCSLRVKHVCFPLISSSNSMTYSVVLMCQTVVGLHAKHVGERGRGGG